MALSKIFSTPNAVISGWEQGIDGFFLHLCNVILFANNPSRIVSFFSTPNAVISGWEQGINGFFFTCIA